MKEKYLLPDDTKAQKRKRVPGSDPGKFDEDGHRVNLLELPEPDKHVRYSRT